MNHYVLGLRRSMTRLLSIPWTGIRVWNKEPVGILWNEAQVRQRQELGPGETSSEGSRTEAAEPQSH